MPISFAISYPFPAAWSPAPGRSLIPLDLSSAMCFLCSSPIGCAWLPYESHNSCVLKRRWATLAHRHPQSDQVYKIVKASLKVLIFDAPLLFRRAPAHRTDRSSVAPSGINKKGGRVRE